VSIEFFHGGEVTTKNLFVVKTNSDTCEGRGSTVILGYFTDRGKAKSVARGRGVFGSDADVVLEAHRTVFTERGIFLLGEQINCDVVEDVRERALAKLTKEEKDALGLT